MAYYLWLAYICPDAQIVSPVNCPFIYFVLKSGLFFWRRSTIAINLGKKIVVNQKTWPSCLIILIRKFTLTELRHLQLQEVIRLFEDFADQYQNITKSHGSQLGIEELQRGKESVFKVAVALEKFVLDYSQYHLNRAEPLKKITRQKMGE